MDRWPFCSCCSWLRYTALAFSFRWVSFCQNRPTPSTRKRESSSATSSYVIPNFFTSSLQLHRNIHSFHSYNPPLTFLLRILNITAMTSPSSEFFARMTPSPFLLSYPGFLFRLLFEYLFPSQISRSYPHSFLQNIVANIISSEFLSHTLIYKESSKLLPLPSFSSAFHIPRRHKPTP